MRKRRGGPCRSRCRGGTCLSRQGGLRIAGRHTDRARHRLAQDDELLAWAAAAGICIEVCPTSNYLTGAVRPGEVHPVRRFLGAGCEVVLGDDNPSQTGSPLSAEAEGLLTRQGLTPEELDTMSAAAIAHAFCDTDTRERLRATAPDQAEPQLDTRAGGHR